jgi:hypothetical protein
LVFGEQSAFSSQPLKHFTAKERKEKVLQKTKTILKPHASGVKMSDSENQT